MKKLLSILLLFFAGAPPAQAVDVSAVHFRAAGVDMATQKFLLQWNFPNAQDTVNIKNVQVLMHTKDAQGNEDLTPIDTLSNQATQYIDNVNGCCASATYALRLSDKNPSTPSVSTDLFCTMQLSEPTLDSCANAINLQWSAYQKFDKFYYRPVAEFSDEVRYHIYGYVGENIFKPDSLVWLATAGNATSYALPVVREKKYHHLLVAAVYNEGADTSFSNRVQLYVPLPQRPQYITLDSVVVSEHSTMLRFHIDNATEYNHFWVEKSGDANVSFEPIEEFFDKIQTSVQLSAGGNSITFYRISAVNNCGRVVVSSPVATTLGVEVRSVEKSNDVRWNAIGYSGFDAKYNVYRTAPNEFITSFDNILINNVLDDLSLLPDSAIGATFCYVVEAIIQDNSLKNICYVRSAEACSAITPQAYMPNAIQLSSDAQNPLTGKSRNLFEPVSSYAHTYTLHIYARAGKQIYSGSEAWNGRENNTGNFVSEGSYIYFVKITFANGSRVEKTGDVTVVY